MPITGQQAIANNIVKFDGGFLEHIHKTMNSVRKILDDKVTENISHTDHSLADLRKLDHPYATRHGEQGIKIHDPYWLVHNQSGELLKAKVSGIVEASWDFGQLKAGAYVGLSEAEAEHASYVIWGTSKMIPRPVLQGSLDQVKDEIKDILQKNLRDVVSHFKGI